MQLTAVSWTLLLFYGSELLTRWRPVNTLFARVCSQSQSVHPTGVLGGGKVKESDHRFVWTFSVLLKRCLGTTKQRLMDTWTSWRRPRGRTWTLRMRMAWLPPYWLLSTDMLMLFSSYAAESKHGTLLSITWASSHI